MKIEDNPAFAERLPRICYVLGGENNPIKTNEEFKAKGHIGKYRIHGGIIEWCEDNTWASASIWDVCEFINQPEVIIRAPQFSDDEKALMREFVKTGYTLFYRCAGGSLRVRNPESHDWISLPGNLLRNLTSESDEIDVAAYLESEVTK